MPIAGIFLIILIFAAGVLVLFPRFVGGYERLEKHFVIEDKEKNNKNKENEENDD